jgi:AFG3 family protein
LIFLAGMATVFTLSAYNDRYKEITWRDFVNEYLNKERIEKLEVINKKWVRLSLKNPEMVHIYIHIFIFFINVLIYLFQKIPWFSIGSVDAFERNLEAAQSESSPDNRNYVPVFYRDEIEALVLY